jgi:hypothetical protein
MGQSSSELDLRALVNRGIDECGWSDATVLDVLLDICGQYPRIERQVRQDLEHRITEELGESEDDGQPSDLKEHEDFTKDGELDNIPGDQVG